MPKRCPECKSKSTKQIDNTNQAYCLSCYNKFQSFEKKPENQIERIIRERKEKVKDGAKL